MHFTKSNLGHHTAIKILIKNLNCKKKYQNICIQSTKFYSEKYSNVYKNAQKNLSRVSLDEFQNNIRNSEKTCPSLHY